VLFRSGIGAAFQVILEENPFSEANPTGPFWVVTAVNVLSGGIGYTQGDLLTFSGGDQDPSNDAGAFINTDENGSITSIDVGSGGQLFDETDTVQSVLISKQGSYYGRPGVASVQMLDGGRYFRRSIVETQTKLPEAKCIGTVTDNWEERFYRGYSELIAVNTEFKSGPDCPAAGDPQPLVTISGGNGSGAEACAVVTDGKISSIVLTNKGYGYTEEPDVTISAGFTPPIQATAEAIVSNGEVSSIAITEQGDGYQAGYPCLRTRRCPLPDITISLQ